MRDKALPLLRTVAIVAIVFCSGAIASAQSKTDVVTLLNGDRFTGEIKALDRGRLQLSTDDAGTIEIEWDNIAGIRSTREFDIGTSDGRRLLGSFGVADQRIVSIVGTDVVVAVPMTEIASIFPIGASLWAKLDGSVDAGFSYTRSSGIAQTTLNTNTLYRRPAFLAQLTSSATITQQDEEVEGDEGDDRSALEFAYIRYRGRWFIGGGGRLESNESLGLLLRAQAVGSIGLRPVNTNRAQFEVGGGLVINEERGVDTEPTQNLEALFSLKTSYYTYDRPKTEIYASVLYYPSLSTWGRRRLQIDSSVRRELLKDFFFSLNLFDTFDSDPPNPDSARNDIGVVTSIGWSY